jgi:ribosomal protein S15P/S13E
MTKKIEEQELKNLQNLNTEFNKIKTQLGDAELQKHSLLKRIEELRTEFAALETDLTTKYGKDTIVNLETGEITKKEEPKENNGKDK